MDGGTIAAAVLCLALYLACSMLACACCELTPPDETNDAGRPEDR